MRRRPSERRGRGTERPRPIRRTLAPIRLWLYGAVLLTILVARFLPGTRSDGRFDREVEPSTDTLVVSGLGLAPDLIDGLVREYQRQYPEIPIRFREGGTKHALEDVLNQKANVAFLSRPLTDEESAIVRSVGDTLRAFPIALGATAVITSRDTPLDSLSVDDLRALVQGQAPSGWSGPPSRVYAPDPNLGLWTHLMRGFGLSETATEPITWLPHDTDVAEAVRRDRGSLGIVSTLALGTAAGDSSWKSVRVLGVSDSLSSPPSEAAIANGQYPLYHYLYVSCLSRTRGQAAPFVTFLVSGRGQRFVRREGYLPARDVAHEVMLVQKPIGASG